MTASKKKVAAHLKYRRSTVAPAKSAQEIADICARYGASRFEMQWDSSGRLTGIRFALRHPKWGDVPVSLKARTDTFRQLLERSGMSMNAASEQAYRAAWRQLRDYVEQSLLAVETGLFPVHEVFFAQIETKDPATGNTVTMGELLQTWAAPNASGVLMIGTGGRDA